MGFGVLWDKDGPLIESWTPYRRYLDIVLETFDRPKPWADDGDPRRHLRGDYKAMYEAWGIDFEAHGKRVWDLYTEHVEGHVSPAHPGIPSLLRDLHTRSIPNGVVSTARTAPLVADLRRAGIDHLLAPVVSHDHVGDNVKPHPLGIIIGAQALNRPRTFFVGDLVSDIDAGRNAQPYLSTRLVTIAIGYGWGHPDVLRAAKPDEYFATVGELTDFLSHQR